MQTHIFFRKIRLEIPGERGGLMLELKLIEFCLIIKRRIPTILTHLFVAYTSEQAETR